MTVTKIITHEPVQLFQINFSKHNRENI